MTDNEMAREGFYPSHEATKAVPREARMGRLEAWLRERRMSRTLRRYGGIQWCPWCKQCAQDNNAEWRFDPWASNPMFDMLTCGVCGGTSLWVWGMGMHYQRPLASGVANRADDSAAIAQPSTAKTSVSEG